MKKKLFGLLTAAMLLMAVGCGQTEEPTSSTIDEDTLASNLESMEEEVASSIEEDVELDDTVVRVGSLKGPTTIGLVNLISQSEAGETKGNYEFTMESAADAIVSKFAAGELDIALVPSNVSATLNNKLAEQGGVSVININTLGVLEIVTGDDSISSIEDLSGKTLLISGQGATPEYTMNYLLEQAGVTDCTLEFHSEHSEIAALLLEDATQVALLPQPFATAVQIQNTDVHSIFNLTDTWNELTDDGSQLITGVTIVRNSFLEEHPVAVATYMEEAKASTELANSDVEGTAALVVSQGIIEKEPVAVKAIPSCQIVCIEGEEMKAALSGYLQVLYNADPTSVGGALPEDSFYYIGE